MSRWDLWWRRIGQVAGASGRLVAFGLGVRIFLMASSDPHQKPWLYVAALALMGVPAAGALERLASLATRLLLLLESTPERKRESEDERE